MAGTSAVAERISRADLIQIVERAAFLQERFGNAFVPTGEVSQAAVSRMTEWKECAASRNEELFRKRLELDRLTTDRALDILGPVRLDPSEALPAWAGTLQQAVEAAGRLTPEGAEATPAPFPFLNPQDPVAFEEVFAPFVVVASGKVRREAASAVALLSAEAYTALERALLKSLSAISSETMDLEFSVFQSCRQAAQSASGGWAGMTYRQFYDEFVGTMREGGLVEFVREYAVLARFLATVADLWVEATAGFLKRLEEDLPAIRERFCGGTDPGQVVELRPSLSDRHKGGRSTIWVRFQHGPNLYYKPKDIVGEELFYNLLDWLNRNGAPLPFKIFQVLNRSTHGWAQEVRHLPCENREEVDRYYLRAGMLLCLAYALEASDCHNENIIACGEHPVLIDMESLVQPRVRLDDDGSAEGATSLANRMFFWDSVLRTALLPRWEFGLSGESYDVSGLGGVDSQPTSVLRASWEHVNTDLMRLRQQKVQTAARQNVVMLGDQRMVPGDYAGRIIEGFEQMYRFLVEHSREMFAPGGPLAAMSEMPVRFIYRHTKVYMIFLKGLFRPQYLRNGADTGIRLEALARPLLQASQPDLSWPILRAEQEALLQGDIPAFYTSAGSDALPVRAGESLPAFFLTSGFDQLRDRFEKLSDEDRQRQAAYIRSSFYSRWHDRSLAVAAQHEIPSRDRKGAVSRALPGRESDLRAAFVAEAVQIARAVRDAAIVSTDGTASWITMAYFAEAQRWQLQPMTPRLYDGIGGVAIFLAAVDKVTGGREFRDLALSGLRSIRADFSYPVFERVLFEPGIGGGLGASSLLYSFVRASELLGEPGLLADAEAVFRMITPERIEADGRLDLLSGVAGTILALLSYHRVTAEKAALELAAACGGHLLAARVAGPSGHRAWPTLERKLITGFSHGAAGIAHALACLYRATGERAFLEAAREGCAYESAAYDPAEQNWPDFRYPPVRGKHVFQCSWCHGAPGIALGRLGMLDVLDGAETRADLERALRKTSQCPLIETDHLCCGNLGRAEILLIAGRTLGATDYKERAMRLAETVTERARRNGQYLLGWSHGPYVPSFHQGMSGIGYELLRLAYPDTVPSVLLWE